MAPKKGKKAVPKTEGGAEGEDKKKKKKKGSKTREGETCAPVCCQRRLLAVWMCRSGLFALPRLPNKLCRHSLACSHWQKWQHAPPLLQQHALDVIKSQRSMGSLVGS